MGKEQTLSSMLWAEISLTSVLDGTYKLYLMAGLMKYNENCPANFCKISFTQQVYYLTYPNKLHSTNGQQTTYYITVWRLRAG